MRRLFNRRLETEDLPHIKRPGKKNKPPDSAWLQQKLTAYRPLLTFKYGLVIAVLVEIGLLAIGSLLWASADTAHEMVIDYTFCMNTNMTILPNPREPFSILLDTDNSNNVTCFYNLTLNDDYNGDVVFYYGMQDFYQNNRLYFRSRSDIQLQGAQLGFVEDCQPYKTGIDAANRTLPIAPCGAVANSLFNDTFELFYYGKTQVVKVPWSTKNLLSRAVKSKYQNPKGKDLCKAFANTVRPEAWSVDVCDLDDGEGGKGFENFDFMVWMQTAALPTFRKLYRRLKRDGDPNFTDGLPSGQYLLKIKYMYPVDEYNSRKRFIITKEEFHSQKSYFLPLCFFITAWCIFVAMLISGLLHFFRCASLQRGIHRVVQFFKS